MSSTTSTNIAGNNAKSLLSQSDFLTDNKDKSSLDKNAFLTLLVTQLQYQDPLNPMDDKEFVAQMAQFSSLEQLTNINTGIEKLTTNGDRQEMLGAVSFIGKDVLATSDQVSKVGTEVSTINYTLPSAAKKVTANIYDASGNIVHSAVIGAQNAGDYTITWDGKDYNGNAVPDGVYTVAIGAEASSGASILVDTSVSGTVTGVYTTEGKNQLVLSDGRKIDLAQVKQVINKTSDETADSGDSDDSGDSSAS